MCDKCNQTGVISSFDMVPYGSYYVPMPTSEACDCLLSGTCPGCGAELWDICGKYSVCPNCRRIWDEDMEEVK